MAGGRRRWGWHRLDPEVAGGLIALADLPPRALVLDVGAGLGALTRPLAEAGHRVVALELHPARAAELRRRFGDRVRVARADVADLRLPRRPFHVVANPPFAVTSPLLRRLLHPGSQMVTATLVLESAAAHRWAGPAAPAAARWRAAFAVELGPAIARRSFDPPAAVPARVLLLRRHQAAGRRRP